MRHCFRVRPLRATSGIGHEVNEARIFAAMARPSAWLSWWYADLTCWAHDQATSTSTCQRFALPLRRADARRQTPCADYSAGADSAVEAYVASRAPSLTHISSQSSPNDLSSTSE